MLAVALYLESVAHWVLGHLAAQRRCRACGMSARIDRSLHRYRARGDARGANSRARRWAWPDAPCPGSSRCCSSCPRATPADHYRPVGRCGDADCGQRRGHGQRARGHRRLRPGRGRCGRCVLHPDGRFPVRHRCRCIYRHHRCRGRAIGAHVSLGARLPRPALRKRTRSSRCCCANSRRTRRTGCGRSTPTAGSVRPARASPLRSAAMPERSKAKSFIKLIAGSAWESGQFPPSLHDLAERLKRRENFSNLLVQVDIWRPAAAGGSFPAPRCSTTTAASSASAASART